MLNGGKEEQCVGERTMKSMAVKRCTTKTDLNVRELIPQLSQLSVLLLVVCLQLIVLNGIDRRTGSYDGAKTLSCVPCGLVKQGQEHTSLRSRSSSLELSALLVAPSLVCTKGKNRC